MFLQFVLSFVTPVENSDLHTGKSMYLLIGRQSFKTER